jgi:hypothetical protein
MSYMEIYMYDELYMELYVYLNRALSNVMMMYNVAILYLLILYLLTCYVYNLYIYIEHVYLHQTEQVLYKTYTISVVH